MLTGELYTPSRNVDLQTLVNDLVRIHISRFPLNVRSEGDGTVHFDDDRLGTTVATLEAGDDKGKRVFDIKSFRIFNEKYATHSTGYRRLRTTNISRAFKLLQQYVTPLTQSELSIHDSDTTEEIFREWRRGADIEYSKVIRANNISPWSGVDVKDLLEDMINYKKTGVPFTVGSVASYMNDDIIAAYLENKSRKEAGQPCTHVFINPDDTVHVTTYKPDTRLTGSYGADDISGQASFTTIDEVPEATRSHIAILKLVAEKTFVPQVGSKNSNNSFWVY